MKAMLFCFTNSKTISSKSSCCHPSNEIWFKYRKSSASTKSMLAMFTEAKQYCLKGAQKYILQKYYKTTTAKNKFFKYPLNRIIKNPQKI